MKFEDYDISEEIKQSLFELGLKRPTDIQFKAIPPILKGEDVLAIAQTGTGKTAAFVIPVLHLLQTQSLRKSRRSTRCLVMLPTRELAIQIATVFEQIGKYTRLNVGCVYGGVDQDKQIAKLGKGVDILVTTPGRMFDLQHQGHIELDSIEILVLDEADQMLDAGFVKDIRDVIKKLPRRHQTLFFSATIGKDIKKLAYEMVRNAAIRIQIAPKDPVSKNISHSVAFIGMDDKRFFLERLVNEAEGKKIMVFVRTKVRAERVAAAMKRVEIESLTLHGDKDQQERQAALEDFKKGHINLLIATDVSARGIDISGIDYVVNYDMPEQAENYVHRVGRTGRGTKKGQAISFCSPEEEPLLKDIETLLGMEIPVTEISNDDYEATLDLSADNDYNWQKLIQDAIKEEDEKASRKKSK